LFARLSAAEQAMFLHQTLLDLEQGTEYLETIIAAWRAGDVDAMERLIFQQFETSSVQGERLRALFIEERNRTMSEVVLALMEKGTVPFVVVGAGHLIGPEGLVALLRESGYRVEPLSPSGSPAATENPEKSGLLQ
jgi:uncharacterized protein YbaP (TraB family)